MCGRFTQTVQVAALMEAFPGVEFPDDPAPRYNIAPTQEVLAIANDASTRATLLRWGLIPSWAKDRSIASKTINARAETLAEKPAFRAALKRRRCLILADGFYEWPRGKTTSRGRGPTRFALRSGRPFAFAGLWESWQPPEGGDPLRTCTVITVAANALVATVHDRMPALLIGESARQWLDVEGLRVEAVGDLLLPCPAELMVARRASPLVNSPAVDSPECLLADSDLFGEI